MRIVIFGIGDISIKVAEEFLSRDHELIIVDSDKDQIEELRESLDCGFLIGDASYPSTMQELNPTKVDLFLALTNRDQSNLVACLVARSMGVKRTILRVEDPSFEHVCDELELTERLVPSLATAQQLIDSVFNEHQLELFHIIKEKVGLYRLVVKQAHPKKSSDLKIPDYAKIICYLRDNALNHYDEPFDLEEGDEILLLTDSERLAELISSLNGD